MGARLHQASLVQDQDAVGVRGEVQVVCDHDGGAALGEAPQGPEDALGGEGVQAGGGLVEDEYGGVAEHGPCDGDALELAAGEP
ncbi:hypothetical protein BG653_06648 [Streptomyces platensis]|uniref:Uncharacterized protein n=1 Tax=Streptomyces platensis TaxID=58346 RepID=A0ABX3XNT2_STRPT|nr:hypothetical protein BG653_06648 [Streptomyces platensis]